MSNKTAKLLPLRCLLRKVCYVLFSKRSYKNYLQANWPDWLMSVAHSFCPILNPTSLILRSTITLFYSHADPLPHWSYGPQSPRFTPILTPTPLMPTTTPFYSYPYPQHWCPQPPCFIPILTPTPLMPTTTPFYSHPYPQHWCPQPPRFTHILTHHRAWTQLMVGWVLLYVHINRRLIRDGSPGRPPRLSHSSWALMPKTEIMLLLWM